jgi:hypothetical protein
MGDFGLLTFGFVSAFSGLSWLALAMEAHWAQVHNQQTQPPQIASRLRLRAVAALAASFFACLGADHASIASLVWVMMLSAAAITVAMALAYYPRLLAWLSWPALARFVLPGCSKRRAGAARLGG